MSDKRRTKRDQERNFRETYIIWEKITKIWKMKLKRMIVTKTRKERKGKILLKKNLTEKVTRDKDQEKNTERKI